MNSLIGIEGYLNEGCYIKVTADKSYNNRKNKKILIEILKKSLKKNKSERIVLFTRANSILSGLKFLSVKRYNSSAIFKKLEFQETILLDELLLSPTTNYSIHFYGLSNNQYLSTICIKSTCGEYIPLQSIITNTIQEGIEILNETLHRIKKQHLFQKFVEYGFELNFLKASTFTMEAIEAINGRQKTIGEKK